MSEYTATVRWVRQADEIYRDNRYSRGHTWQFDGGATIAASASPQVVPPPYSIAAHVDPEEAFVASIASCHMLFFLGIAAKKQFVVDQYVDHATGIMAPNAQGVTAITRVTLYPRMRFSGSSQPTRRQLEDMHRQAHRQCFIANSVKTVIEIQIEGID